jgi:Peptidase family M48
MGARELLLGLSLCAVVGCATTSSAPKAREITPAERSSLSGTLEPLLTAAGLWRGPADACAAAFGVLEGDVVGVALAPHAPCRVRLVLTEETLTRLDRATLRVLLAHEIAHMQLGHPDARQARTDAQKQTQQGVKSAASVGSKAAGLIPGIGGFISKGIGTARKAHHGDGDARKSVPARGGAAGRRHGRHVPERGRAGQLPGADRRPGGAASLARRGGLGAMASRAPGLRRTDRGARRAVSWFYVAGQSGHAGVSH